MKGIKKDSQPWSLINSFHKIPHILNRLRENKSPLNRTRSLCQDQRTKAKRWKEKFRRQPSTRPQQRTPRVAEGNGSPGHWIREVLLAVALWKAEALWTEIRVKFGLFSSHFHSRLEFQPFSHRQWFIGCLSDQNWLSLNKELNLWQTTKAYLLCIIYHFFSTAANNCGYEKQPASSLSICTKKMFRYNGVSTYQNHLETFFYNTDAWVSP